MKKIIFKGSGTAIITPFTDNGVNYKELAKMLEYQINEGTDSIIVCGTTGEASTMSDEEKKKTIKLVVDTVNKRIPVIAGTGSNDTKKVIEMTKYAESVGARGPGCKRFDHHRHKPSLRDPFDNRIHSHRGSPSCIHRHGYSSQQCPRVAR